MSDSWDEPPARCQCGKPAAPGREECPTCLKQGPPERRPPDPADLAATFRGTAAMLRREAECLSRKCIADAEMWDQRADALQQKRGAA